MLVDCRKLCNYTHHVSPVYFLLPIFADSGSGLYKWQAGATRFRVEAVEDTSHLPYHTNDWLMKDICLEDHWHNILLHLGHGAQHVWGSKNLTQLPLNSTMTPKIAAGNGFTAALPTIGKDLHIMEGNLQWVVSSYTLTSVGFSFPLSCDFRYSSTLSIIYNRRELGQ
ncbi:hypothetical protein BS47DRAFT_671817 [Hydnum rufescens UP504]|uniref:Uncharacterized protein n=1 Tax=Hydnum rufescens UP504 TaxID=1448309 RepID=A0A9P6AFM1_9AGAM|nr:hypothetical protein BS47DRAFT_671817 [Hydnum rufescens UP504]